MKRLVWVCVMLICFLQTKAQFTVTTNSNAAALAQRIVGSGVTILNPQFKGASISAGFFKDLTGTIGIDSGIILTTGRAASIDNTLNSTTKGANAPASGTRTSTNNNGAGDADLTLYANIATKDACILEFDFIPQGDSINVKFVFASDEYQGATSAQEGYICNTVNDAFAFLISGPGISGQKNIALVPGTNIPVAINTINNGQVSTNNVGTLTYCTNYGSGSPFTSYYVGNRNGVDISYNGFTTVLRAEAKLTPCQTYHIKLVIADGSDNIYDSGVFIEASSFSSNGISVTNTGGFVDAQNNVLLVEGCKSSQIRIELTNPPSSPLTLPVTYTGTATYGVDYLPLPTSLTFGVGEISKAIDIVPIMDGITEPTETVIVSIGSGACSSSPTSKVTLYIKDSIAFGHVKDTFVCSKFPTLLSAPYNDTTTNQYTWSNGDTTRQTYAYAPSNSFWVVHRFANNCYNVDTFHIVNGDPTVSVGLDVSFCYKDSVQVIANVLPTGGNYLWSTGSTADNIYVSTTGNFSVKYTAPNGCYLLDDMNATVKPYPFAGLGNDTSLCSYESLNLSAYYPGATYLWNTGATTASIIAKDSGQYTVESTLNGCVARDTILVTPKKSPIANAGGDTATLAGGRVKLMAVQYVDNNSYQWEPAMYLTYANSYNPIAAPPVSMPFFLTVTSVDNCVARDTVLITVKDYGLNIPNSFSPNGDGVNDTWQIDLLSSYLFCKVQVFNRSGQVVFSSIGYEKPWDGTLNGKPLPSATYYYIIDPGYGKPTQTGSVTIIR